VPNSKLYFACKNYLSLFLNYYTTPLCGIIFIRKP
jgi:hypothetical protein